MLVVFDYDSAGEEVTVQFRRWATVGDCANPNSAGAWIPTGDPVDFAWAVGVRTEGPLPVGNQAQATFGEFGIDLTSAGLFSPEALRYAVTAESVLVRAVSRSLRAAAAPPACQTAVSRRSLCNREITS